MKRKLKARNVKKFRAVFKEWRSHKLLKVPRDERLVLFRGGTGMLIPANFFIPKRRKYGL
jgi:hypothetical protein